jgi:hypothetical protein
MKNGLVFGSSSLAILLAAMGIASHDDPTSRRMWYAAKAAIE